MEENNKESQNNYGQFKNMKFLLEKFMNDEKNYVMRLEILVQHFYAKLSVEHKGLEKSN